MRLAGLRVLVVEDEMLVAMTLEDTLTANGADVVGPAMRVEAALAMAEAETLDFAILDINLHGARSYDVARVLRRRGVPFIFATGYGQAEDVPEFVDTPTIAKPYRVDDLLDAVAGELCVSNRGQSRANPS